MKLFVSLGFYDELIVLALSVLFAELMLEWNLFYKTDTVFIYSTCDTISLFEFE
jgi:hypothetical protein